MKKLRILTVTLLLLAMALSFAGCCQDRCCFDPLRWWEPCGGDCCPCGDPCDPCDTRGC
jgi:hypothetical protein